MPTSSWSIAAPWSNIGKVAKNSENCSNKNNLHHDHFTVFSGVLCIGGSHTGFLELLWPCTWGSWVCWRCTCESYMWEVFPVVWEEKRSWFSVSWMNVRKIRDGNEKEDWEIRPFVFFTLTTAGVSLSRESGIVGLGFSASSLSSRCAIFLLVRRLS